MSALDNFVIYHKEYNSGYDQKIAIQELIELYKENTELRADNARLKALVDEISGLITQFKKARNTTGSIDAIAKIVVWNVEQEDRIGKEKREQLEATD